MAFKTVLSVVGVSQSDQDLRLAIALCRQIGAHLSVLVVSIAPPPPIGEYSGVLAEAWAREREEDGEKLDARANEISALLARSEISADVTGEYTEKSRADDIVGLRARYADITVFGPELMAGREFKALALKGALFDSRAPILILPNTGAANLQPKRIMVAWDGGPEASRAVRDSLALLVNAEDTRIVLVDPQGAEGGKDVEPGADLAAYLARHGTRVSVERIPSSGQTIADALRVHAVDMSADLIVMGAYGHSRWREQMLGGVTKSMLDEPALALLMSR